MRASVHLCIFALAGLSSCSSSCGHSRASSHEPLDAGSAPPPGETTAWASNVVDVSRFSDEVPFGPDAVIGSAKTFIRRSPGDGEVIATLNQGALVVKLSQRGSEDLVMFDDPKNEGGRLIGWVAQSAIQDGVPIPVPSNTAPVPVAPLTDGGSWFLPDSGPVAPVTPSPTTPNPEPSHHPKQHRPKGGRRQQPQQPE